MYKDPGIEKSILCLKAKRKLMWHDKRKVRIRAPLTCGITELKSGMKSYAFSIHRFCGRDKGLNFFPYNALSLGESDNSTYEYESPKLYHHPLSPMVRGTCYFQHHCPWGDLVWHPLSGLLYSPPRLSHPCLFPPVSQCQCPSKAGT